MELIPTLIRSVKRLIEVRFRPKGGYQGSAVHHAIHTTDAFDWEHFTLESFIAWLSQESERELLVLSWDFPTNITGGWITSDDCEIFLYASRLSGKLKDHVVLHEIGHWMMCHQTINLNRFMENNYAPNEVLNILNRRMLNRSNDNRYSARQEWEAEYFATLLSTKIVDTNPTIFSENLKPFKADIL